MSVELNLFSALRSRYEELRLQTFRDWPVTAHAEPNLLAAAGFFFTGKSDRVQCAFCHGFLTNWEVGDVPNDEHRKHFPQCPFVLGRNVGNVPIGSTASALVCNSGIYF
jgi:baculoviral IAP repeat-containing protein 2/3